MTVAATVVVEFGHGVDSGALVLVELDEAMNLDLDGAEKTSFSPGDTPYFLVHHDYSVQISDIKSSSGMVSGGTIVSRDRSQQMQFTNIEDSQELPHIPAGALAWTWWGNDPVIDQDGRTLKATGAKIPAIGEVSYSIQAKQYKLTPPPMTLTDDETYPILIVISMAAAV